MSSAVGKQRLMAFLLNNRERASAQLLQDLFAAFFFHEKGPGYFVEFGATDGISLSNTCMLEALGWRGILAEPLASWHEKLRRNRNCHIDTRCVYSKSNEIVRFRDTYENPELAGIEKELKPDISREKRGTYSTGEVLTVSLMDLLATYDAPRSIEYLSVDTEGSELEILGAFDFSAYRIAVLTVEHNFVDDQREGLKSLLERNGFVRVCESISRWDDWYLNANVIEDASVYRD